MIRSITLWFVSNLCQWNVSLWKTEAWGQNNTFWRQNCTWYGISHGKSFLSNHWFSTKGYATISYCQNIIHKLYSVSVQGVWALRLSRHFFYRYLFENNVIPDIYTNFIYQTTHLHAWAFDLINIFLHQNLLVRLTCSHLSKKLPNLPVCQNKLI